MRDIKHIITRHFTNKEAESEQVVLTQFATADELTAMQKAIQSAFETLKEKIDTEVENNLKSIANSVIKVNNALTDYKITNAENINKIKFDMSACANVITACAKTNDELKGQIDKLEKAMKAMGETQTKVVNGFLKLEKFVTDITNLPTRKFKKLKYRQELLKEYIDDCKTNN